MSGLLRGWLREEPWATTATWANACGAFAVSRLLCSPEYATWAELQAFLKDGSRHHALRKDENLNHIHWATTRRPQSPSLMAFAIDHRSQLEAMADKAGVPREKISELKVLAVNAAAKVAGGRPGFGMLLDEKYGRDALFAAAKQNFWIGRPVELPGSRPLRFEFSGDIGSQLVDWPVTHTIKALSFYHPDDPAEMKEDQQRTLRGLYDAARRVGRELLVEIIAGKHGPLDDTTIARAMGEFYALGIKPDWWKLEPQASPAAWKNIAAVIEKNDAFCRGIVLLGLDAPEAELAKAFAAVSGVMMVKGFAVGRTLFGAVAEKWFAGGLDDKAATDEMAARFRGLTDLWQKSRLV